MARAKENVIGLTELDKTFKMLAKALGPPATATIMAEAAQPVLEEAQENLLRQGLLVSGALYDTLRIVKVNQFMVAIVAGDSNVQYAAVHEYGGTFVITEKQRAFFWAKFAETGDDMWKALALSYSYTIPTRPYLRPAIDMKKDEVTEKAGQAVWREYTKMIGIGGGG